jgi:glycogen operon protein
VFFNSGDEPVEVTVPDERHGAQWDAVVDTAGERTDERPLDAGETFALEPRSMIVLREVDGTDTPTDDSVEASLRIRTETPAPAPKPETTT